MKKAQQQLIIIFEAEDLSAVEQIVDAHTEDEPHYKSPAGQLPIIFSIKAQTNEIFEALLSSKADFIMTSIGMESENVFSVGAISQKLFFNQSNKANNATVDYQAALKKAVEREDYTEAARLRDMIASRKFKKNST